ncbi:MAG: hypothetical protein IPH11_03785 [Ignavibacteriales bacterium]|nr:hypothetical protein [Ignavibacteriales bacterium]
MCKAIFSILLICFYLEPIFSQQQLFKEEISLEVEGSFTTITFTLEAYSAVFANSTITDDYSTATEVIIGNHTNTGFGWRVFWEAAPFEPIAHGFYKLFTDYEQNYVFIDLRDCKWANQSYPIEFQYDTDFFLKYNATSDKFYYKDKNASTYTQIPDRGIVGIWTIKNGVRVTSCFEDYTENNLAVYSPLTKAKLFWEAPPPQDYIPSKYRIWYAWSLDTVEPEPEDYYWIADIDDAFLSFNDEAIIDQNFIQTASHTSYYHIEAFNGTKSLYTSNNVNVFSNTDWTKTLKITNDNNHPRLAWTPYNIYPYSVYNYKVYRKVETIPPGRPPAVYQLIYETGYDTLRFEYTDYDFTMGAVRILLHIM